MDDPIEIIAFARSGNMVSTRRNIADMLERYRQHKDEIVFAISIRIPNRI